MICVSPNGLILIQSHASPRACEMKLIPAQEEVRQDTGVTDKTLGTERVHVVPLLQVEAEEKDCCICLKPAVVELLALVPLEHKLIGR